jgi:hypothetical protein
VTRKVTRTATVSLEGNTYAVDPALVARRVELRYDPEDLSVIDVFFEGSPAGVATPFVIGRHTHRRRSPSPHVPNRATGVDYLGMVAAAHEEQPAPAASTSPSSPCSQTTTRGGQVSAAPWVSHFGLTRTPSASASRPRTSSPATPTPRPWPASASA